jgi:putative effector of murein hydrolase LrgA (UPF0299 family)
LSSLPSVEALLTFFLMSAVYGSVIAYEKPPVAGYGIGFTLLFAALVLARVRAGVMERRIRGLELARARRAEAPA